MTSSTDSELILAGVRACILAQCALQFPLEDGPLRETLRTAAYQVLEAYGLRNSENVPPTAAPKPPLAKKAVLVWPPPEPTIPAVYTENYYELSHQLLAWPTSSATEATILLVAEERLVFSGLAYWSESRSCWVMQMKTQANAEPLCWLLSKNIKPGAEIPKVVDAATQARSTDP